MKKIKFLVIALFSLLMIVGCGGQSGDDNNQSAGNEVFNHGSKVTNILFAHGYGSDKDTFDTYVKYTKNYDKKDWTPYRTDVNETGSIANRAKKLADYIVGLDVNDDSIVAVGHSMGGLDLRYIVCEGHDNKSDHDNIFYQAAKKIHKIYTIAAPHKGVDAARLDLVGLGGEGANDLKPENMKEFNKKYPYINMEIDGRKITMLTMRFRCNKNDDGVVKVDSQSLDRAPNTKVFEGKHSSSAVCIEDAKEELEQTDIIKKILENKL